ncbi:MAG: MerR family transcriptional regulator [Chloroflexi bacterium]|jgi:DNA-binding transcriptional MerR regulator|nr:MerR family transcriptional regulator [Chloroflexota bacterium]
MNKSDRPLYNIGAVSRRTGISPATLRAWERRYDFPQPARSEGGHRLYSEHDVQRLQWVSDRLEQGMQTRHAIEALRLRQERGETISPEADIARASPTLSNAEALSYLEQIQQQLSAALLSNDLAHATHIFREALAPYPPEALIEHIIQPTFADIGEAWAVGEINVSTEHLAAQYLRSRLMMWLHTGPPAYEVPPTVLACAPGELHEGGLLILGTLLRRRRWPIAYLGQSTPLDDLAQFIRETNPLAVVLAAMRKETAEALTAWPDALPDLVKEGRPLITFGGRIFVEQPKWQMIVPGLYLGDDFEAALATLEPRLRRLVGMAPLG